MNRRQQPRQWSSNSFHGFTTLAAMEESPCTRNITSDKDFLSFTPSGAENCA